MLPEELMPDDPAEEEKESPTCFYCREEAEGSPPLCRGHRLSPPPTADGCGCRGENIVYGYDCSECNGGFKLWVQLHDQEKGYFLCQRCGRKSTYVPKSPPRPYCLDCRRSVERRSAALVWRWLRFTALTNPELRERQEERKTRPKQAKKPIIDK